MTAAGFYHCSVKGVGRAKGRSVVAAAAYRSGERLVDEWAGQTADYRARGGVLDSFILVPDA
ncbi:MAG: MobA/MobL family protein, partial [Acetobacteraceae bacterium]|nr:MobA/MobL family protein [Acetobacteraceae bacterium]